MKKVISVLCAVCLLIGIVPLNTMAFDNKVEQPHGRAEVILENSSFATQQTAQMVKTIETDLKNLACFGADPNKIEINSVKNGKISYNYPITEEVTDVYTVTKSEDGTLILDITEGVLSDRIEIHTDGQIFVNGISYGIEPHMSNVDYSLSQIGTGPFTYVGSSQNPNVPLSKKIVSHTITALANIIGLNLGIPKAFRKLMSNVAQKVVSATNANNPTSESMSFKQSKYQSADSIGTDRYYRYNAICYTSINYGGGVSYETYYQHSYFT